MTQEANKPKLAYGQMRDKLEPDDIDGKTAVLTIATADARNFAPEGKGEEFKIVLTFEEFPGDDKADPPTQEKEYVVNSTSYKTLVAKLGDDYDAWAGELVVMTPTTTTFNKQTYEKVHVASPERWDKAMTAYKKATGTKGKR